MVNFDRQIHVLGGRNLRDVKIMLPLRTFSLRVTLHVVHNSSMLCTVVQCCAQ